MSDQKYITFKPTTTSLEVYKYLYVAAETI